MARDRGRNATAATETEEVEVEGGETEGGNEAESTNQAGAPEGFYFVDYSLKKRNDVPERFKGLTVRIPLIRRTGDAAALFTRILQQAGADPAAFTVSVEGEVPTSALHAIVDNHNGRFRLQAQKATVDHANETVTEGEGESKTERPVATEESVLAFPLAFSLAPSERLVGGSKKKEREEKGRKLEEVEGKLDQLSPEEKALYDKLFGGK